MMDAFSYLSVLLSIILGLAITQLLQGLARVIQGRERIRVFWPSIAWGGILILVTVQSWWALFGLRTHTQWSFFPFLIVVAQTINLYLATSLVIPEIAPGEHLDLREHYFKQVTWFFSLTIGMVFISLAKDLVFSGAVPANANTGIQLGFVALAISAMTCRREWFHKLLVTVTIALFSLYIVLLFTQLPGD